MRHEAALIGVLARSGHHGQRGYRRPPRTDRVQRVGIGQPRRRNHFWRGVLIVTVVVPVVVTAGVCVAAALAGLGVAAALTGRWNAYVDLVRQTARVVKLRTAFLRSGAAEEPETDAEPEIAAPVRIPIVDLDE